MVCAQQMPRARASMSLHRPTAPFARKGTTVNRARPFAWPTSRVERRAGVDGMDNAYAKEVTEGQDVHRASMGIKEKDVQRRAIGKRRATRTGEFSKRANASAFLALPAKTACLAQDLSTKTVLSTAHLGSNVHRHVPHQRRAISTVAVLLMVHAIATRAQRARVVRRVKSGTTTLFSTDAVRCVTRTRRAWVGADALIWVAVSVTVAFKANHVSLVLQGLSATIAKMSVT